MSLIDNQRQLTPPKVGDEYKTDEIVTWHDFLDEDADPEANAALSEQVINAALSEQVINALIRAIDYQDIAVKVNLLWLGTLQPGEGAHQLEAVQTLTEKIETLELNLALMHSELESLMVK